MAERPPPRLPPSHEELEGWREVCDSRLATELGVAVLACRRADAAGLAPLDELIGVMQDRLEDFPAYRQADVRFHIVLAETTGSATLVSAMTEAQGAMGALIDHIAHPPEVLASSNAQHRELLAAVRAQDVERATRVVTEHLEATVHVLAGLLPLREVRLRGITEVMSPSRRMILWGVGDQRRPRRARPRRPAGARRARRAAVLRPVRGADARRRARSAPAWCARAGRRTTRAGRPPTSREPPPWWPDFERDFRAYASRPRTRA